MQLLSHWVMDTCFSKGRVFLVWSWRRWSNFLWTFVNNPLNVLLLNFLSWHAKWPTITRWNILVKLPRLRLVGIRTRQATVLCACVIVLKARMMRTKCVCRWIHEILSLVKITGFVECVATSIFCVRFVCCVIFLKVFPLTQLSVVLSSLTRSSNLSVHCCLFHKSN